MSGNAGPAHVRLTARGWTTLVVVVLAWVAAGATGYPALFGLALTLSAACVVAAVSVMLPAPVSIHREVRPARVRRGEDCTATITVTNTSRALPVVLAGTDRVDGTPVAFDFPRLRGGQSASTQVRIPTERRGLISFGPLSVDRRSFADLARVRRSYGEPASVLVEPRVWDALALPPGMRRGHIGADERIAHGGTDLVGLREYVPGDDLRRLHWATSARRGTLMVREDADPAAPLLTVLLDDRAEAYGPGGFDEAVDVAASLLEAATASLSSARLVTVSAAATIELPATPSRAGAGGLAPDTLAHLARLSVHTTQAAGDVSVSSPDVVAIVSGTGVDPTALALTAASAPAGVLALVDEAPSSLVSAMGAVTVLRGPRAPEIVHAWRSALVPSSAVGVR